MEPGAQRAALAALSRGTRRAAFAELSRAARAQSGLSSAISDAAAPRVAGGGATARCSRVISACRRRGWAGPKQRGWSRCARLDVGASAGPGGGWWRARRGGGRARCRSPSCCARSVCGPRRCLADPGAGRFDGAHAGAMATRSSSIAIGAAVRWARAGSSSIRLDGELMVKRLRAAVGGIEVISRQSGLGGADRAGAGAET